MIMKRNYSPMLVTVWLTLTIFFCWGQVSTSTNTESLIVEAPRNQTVPFNSTAVFSCKSRVIGLLGWEIDGREITIDRRNTFCSDRGVCINVTLSNSSNETESVLLVAAIERNNGSMIRCLASETVTSTVEKSEVAILKIFDRPDAPTNFVFSPVSQLHLNLSWDAPFIFPGVQINYTVTVRNVNTSEEIQREGLGDTYYIFNGTEGSSLCDVYQFSVVAVNSAGRSDRSENISSHLPTLPNIEASVESLKHDVMFEDESTVASIRISFEPAGTCWGDLDPVTGYNVILHGDSTNATVSGSHFEDGRVNFGITNAEVNFQYSFRIVAFNGIGNTTSEEFEYYTTDVQDASISMKEDDFVVTCSFAHDSQAQGCQIQLNSPMENITLNISRLNSCGIVIEPSYSPTLYDICALDWETDGTIGELCVPAAVNLLQFVGCGNPPGSGLDPSTPKSQLVIGAAIGGVAGFLLILIVVIVVILLVSCRCMRARKVRVRSNDYGDGESSKYTNGVKVEEVIYNYRPTTERSISQATTDTILPPLPPTTDTILPPVPPIYDAVQNYTKQGDRDSGEMDYSGLNRSSSQLSPTARVEFEQNPQYSALNQAPTYAVLESNSIPLGILPGNHEAYCEIEDLKISPTSPINHESAAESVSVSDTVMIPENEKLYSELPSAGTTVY